MDVPPNRTSSRPRAFRTLLPLVAGIVLTGLVYAVLVLMNLDFLNRYFMGHPISIAETGLFCIAASILSFKSLGIASQKRQLALLRDEDLMPGALADGQNRPSDQWRSEYDAGHVARNWLQALGQLPDSTRFAMVVSRLQELLTRQANRGTTKQLNDDFRELSDREGDAAYDSLGLVRIIAWAIPMLGFLGTVVGITQTLGGLDFSDGKAAVDQLKSGLYVAFDTTAIGLVLSVLAIFLLFPIERSEKSFLGEVDARVRNLISLVLPADDPADNQTALITQLCDGIRVAVAESLATQATIWQATISEAQAAWRTQHTEGTEQFRRLLSTTLTPSLTEHADRLDQSVTRLENVSVGVAHSLQTHSKTWQEALDKTTQEVQTHRRTLLTHTEAMTALADQQVEDRETITAAVRALARAVDFLSHKLPESQVQHAVPMTNKPANYGRAA